MKWFIIKMYAEQLVEESRGLTSGTIVYTPFFYKNKMTRTTLT